MRVPLEDVHASLVADGVAADAQTMSAEKVFWSHFCTNCAPVTWVLGALVIGIGLDFRTGLLALVIGNILGALPVGLNSLLGPRTGLTQIEISRFSFGRFGTRLPATVNWVTAVGWDAVNNVPSVLALVALVAYFHLTLPFWIGLSVLVAIQLTASIYGHHVVQVLAKYVCYVLIVVFAITGVVAILKGGSFVAARAPITPAMFVLAVSMVAGFDIGFAPYSSDYTRYLPRDTKPATIFALSFGGLVLSSFLLELCGLLTASRLHDLSPAGVIDGIAAMTGPFGPVALVAIAVSAVAINSINDNTAAYSLISTGVRIPRHVSAVVTSLCGFALAVAGAAIFAVVTPLTIALFSATEIYTGPVAKLLGGTDIGFFVGFFAASGAYVLFERRRSAAPAAVDFAQAS